MVVYRLCQQYLRAGGTEDLDLALGSVAVHLDYGMRPGRGEMSIGFDLVVTGVFAFDRRSEALGRLALGRNRIGWQPLFVIRIFEL